MWPYLAWYDLGVPIGGEGGDTQLSPADRSEVETLLAWLPLELQCS